MAPASCVQRATVDVPRAQFFNTDLRLQFPITVLELWHTLCWFGSQGVLPFLKHQARFEEVAIKEMFVGD